MLNEAVTDSVRRSTPTLSKYNMSQLQSVNICMLLTHTSDGLLRFMTVQQPLEACMLLLTMCAIPYVSNPF